MYKVCILADSKQKDIRQLRRSTPKAFLVMKSTFYTCVSHLFHPFIHITVRKMMKGCIFNIKEKPIEELVN